MLILCALVLFISLSLQTKAHYTSIPGVTNDTTTAQYYNITDSKHIINGLDSSMWPSIGMVKYEFGVGSFNYWSMDLSTALSNIDLEKEGYDIKEAYIRVRFRCADFFQSTYSGVFTFSDYSSYASFEVLPLAGGEIDYLTWKINLSSLTDSSLSFSFEWNRDGTSSEMLKFESATLFVIHELSSVYEGINIGSNYVLFPESLISHHSILEHTLYDVQTNSYRFKTMIDHQLYLFNVSVPDNIDMSTIEPSQMSLLLNQNGDVVLYIQPDASLPPFPHNSSRMYSDFERVRVSFSAINLTRMEYHTIDKLALTGFIEKEMNSNAFLYCFFPLEIEDLHSISVTFKYRYNFTFSSSDWIEKFNTYEKDKQSEVTPPWWMLIFGAGYFISDWLDLFNVETLASISPTQVPSSTLDKYLAIPNQEKNIDNLNLYKVHLGQFKTLGAWSYDISSLVILNIFYSQDGILYHAAPEEIISNVPDPELEGPLIPVNPVSNNTLSIVKITIGVTLFLIISYFIVKAIYMLKEISRKTS